MKAVMSKDGTGDKSSAYQLHCGLFRLICTNGMVVSDGTFQRISIKHLFMMSGTALKNSLFAIVADATGVPELVSLKGWVSDQFTTDDDTIDVHSYM
jgi:Domain of unknown function (DUF932)